MCHRVMYAGVRRTGICQLLNLEHSSWRHSTRRHCLSLACDVLSSAVGSLALFNVELALPRDCVGGSENHISAQLVL